MKKTQTAFTLLEIMLVVSIIGVLLAAAIYKLAPTMGFAKSTRAQGDISSIRTCLIAYAGSNGFYPTTEQGLMALVNKPTSEPVPTNWHQLMDKLPTDAYSSPYVYRNPSRKNGRGFDLFSAGEDRIPDTADDDFGGN